MLKLLTLGGLAALAILGLARPMPTNHPADAADATKQRHGHEVGFCGWGCEHRSYRDWCDTVLCGATAPATATGVCAAATRALATPGNPELCAQGKLSQKSFAVTLCTATDNLPPNMQGVFWLQGQAASSSIVSFGPSRDGDGLSVWNANSDRHISIRVGGDKVWSGASNGSTWERVEGIDLVYRFQGTPTANPTHFNIIPEAMNPGSSSPATSRSGR